MNRRSKIIKIAIVDRDMDSRQCSLNILQQIGPFEILCYDNVKDLGSATQEYEFIILDIDGIQYSRKHHEKNIIFLTDRKDKMQDAFGPNVYGFIHKDDSFDRFKEIIENVIIRISNCHKIILKTNEGLKTFKLSEITYLQYIDNKVIGMVYEYKNYNLFGYTLTHIKERLGKNFIYVDRGTIINVDKVTSVNKNQLFLQGILQSFDISKRRRKVVKERLKNL